MCQGLVIIIEKLSRNKTTYSPKAFPCSRTGKWEVYLMRSVDVDRRCLLIPPALAKQKEVWYRLWSEFEFISWERFILPDILHENHQRGKKVPFWIDQWELSVLILFCHHGNQLGSWLAESWVFVFIFVITLEACKNLLKKGGGYQPSSEELQVILTPVSSPHIWWFRTPDVGGEMKTRLRSSFCCQTASWLIPGAQMCPVRYDIFQASSCFPCFFIFYTFKIGT